METEGRVGETIPVRHRGAWLSVSCRHRPGNGKGLLYLHGLGGTKEDFSGAWSEAEWKEYALVAVDAPGCGATRGYRRGVPLGVDDIVDVAEAVVERLNVGRLTVVGHSMGGLAGLLFTLRNGRRVERLVSVEGNLVPADCALYSRRVFRERFLGREEAFMRGVAEDLRAGARPGWLKAAARLRESVEDAAFFDYCRSLVEYSDHYPVLELFCGLEIPTLYVHGRESGSPTLIADLGNHGVSVSAIPGSDHFPAWSNPDAYYRCLKEFMESTRS